tara:strand:+ start:1303 stop:1806 length:504 start_codon:yes stop_codon:yes gene_type:complete
MGALAAAAGKLAAKKATASIFTKANVTTAATVAATGVSVYGQMQQSAAVKKTAEYNASLQRLDIEQNIKNREIEAVQDKKRFYLMQEKNVNIGMPLDALYADLEAFEYQALVKDYNIAQGNRTLEAKAKGGLYEGEVRSQTAKNKAAGSLLGGVGKVVEQRHTLGVA